MKRLFLALPLGLLLTSCSDPCVSCSEFASLWAECHEVWEDDYAIRFNCIDDPQAEWFDEDGQLTAEGEDAYFAALYDCESRSDVKRSCSDTERAVQNASSDAAQDERDATCEQYTDPKDMAQDKDCEGYLEAIGLR